LGIKKLILRKEKGFCMGSRKKAGEKIKLIASKTQAAPRWADIRKFSLKRARSRRITVRIKHWRRGRLKI